MKWFVRFSCVFLFYCSLVFAQVKGLSGWNIILDPGHSQTENMGIYNYSEAEKNVRVARALRDDLLRTTDIDTVYLTRANDSEQVSLSQRTDYANSLGAAWYHSIHSDAGAPESNSTLLLWGQYRTGQEKVPPGGKKMSSFMVDLLTRGMRTKTAGSYGDCTFYGCTTAGPYLHVNRMSTMPAELSEAGFHTSPLQNTRNMNAEWKKLEAWTFYWSILKFHNISRPAVHILTGFVSDFENGELINDATVTIEGQSYTTDTYASLFGKYSNDPNQLHNGFYYFENLSTRTLPLIVTAPGYYSDTLEVALTDSFFTFKDLRLIAQKPPVVASSYPSNGSEMFPAWEAITLNFSRPVNPASVEQALTLSPAGQGTFTWLDDYRSALFKPDTLQFEAEYVLSISADAVDRYGHHIDGNGDGSAGDGYQLYFKTGPADLFPPRITGSLPRPNALNVQVQPIINLYYSEPIDSASVRDNMVKLFRSSDMTAVAGRLRHYVIAGKSVLCFFPTPPLAQNQMYKIQIEPGFRDLLGNTEIQQKIFSFKTGADTYLVTPLDRFEAGLDQWLAPQQSGSTSGILTEKTAKSVDTLRVNLLSNSKKSMRLDYGWDLNGSNWLIREYLNSGPAKEVRFTSSSILQAWVLGDGSGTQFRFCIDDRIPNYIAENHEVSPWYKVDWLGWKLVQWDMTAEPAGSWLGDGRLTGTLGFDSIQLSYVGGGSVSGSLFIDDLQLARKNVTLVDASGGGSLPTSFGLEQNHPNPFNQETTITYHLPASSSVAIKIFDVTGRIVKILVQENQQPGTHAIGWDGRDENGRSVASGTYLYQLRTDGSRQTRQMVLTR